MDQFSFNISNDDEKKTFARPSSFYKVTNNF